MSLLNDWFNDKIFKWLKWEQKEYSEGFIWWLNFLKDW